MSNHLTKRQNKKAKVMKPKIQLLPFGFRLLIGGVICVFFDSIDLISMARFVSAHH